MNFRFIIFVVITSLSLFFVNQYFVPDPKKPTTHQNESVHKTQEMPTVGVGALPLFPFYTSEKGENVIGYGFKAAQSTYILPKDALSSVEEKLFVKNNKGLVKEISLINKDPSKEKCLIYSEKQDPVIKTLSLPPGKAYLTLLQIEESSPRTYPALIEHGKLVLGDEKPSINSLVIYDYLGEFMVVGIYDASHEQFIPFSAISSLNNLIDYVPLQSQKNASSTEQFYVLENETMQLVFSNIGGALCEINLPMRNTMHPHSVILPVNEDHLLKKQAPLSDLFPLNAYKTSSNGKLETMQPSEGGYYPLLRRGIARKDPRASTRALPQFYAANITSSDPAIASMTYKLVSITDKQIVFSGTYQDRKITKTFELPTDGEKAPYVLLASVEVQGNTRDLYFTSGVPEVEFVSGRPTPAITYVSYNGSDLTTNSFKLPKTTSNLTGVTPDWTSNANGYFSIIIDPLDKVNPGFISSLVPGAIDPSRITLIDTLSDRYPASKYPGYQIGIPLKADETMTSFRLFLGPLDATVLAKVDDFYTNKVTGYSPHYNKAITYQGFLTIVIEPLARLLSLLLRWCYQFSHSWGLAIILLTILLRLVLYPLNTWSIKSTIGMKVVGPEIKKIQERYKKNPTKLRSETMRIYKENGVSPLGCIVPLFLQMPFLFAMFSVLKTTFAIRGASFVPGWINNLSAPDVLFSWGFSIPYIGDSFHLLPVLSAALMYFQSKQSAAKTSEIEMSDLEKQQQKLSLFLPLIMLLVFYNMPSGLSLYWISASALQMIQHSITLKSIQKKRLRKNPNELIVKVKK